MLNMIGFMMACYFITRMSSFCLRSGDRQEHLLVKVFAVITIMASIVGVVLFCTTHSL